MVTRRQFLIRTAGLVPGLAACARAPVSPGPMVSSGPASSGPLVLNDIHAQLNATRVARVERPRSVDDVVRLVRAARTEGHAQAQLPRALRHGVRHDPVDSDGGEHQGQSGQDARQSDGDFLRRGGPVQLLLKRNHFIKG